MRIFLALIPDPESWEALVRRTVSVVPGKSVRWTHPDDLHMTFLFGEVQPEQRRPEWISSVEAATMSLSPMVRNRRERKANLRWDPKRRLLVVEFDREERFWREVEIVHRSLFEKLLGGVPDRSFWPHLTLSRHAGLAQESVLEIGRIVKETLEQHPLQWVALRLLASEFQPAPREPRYRSLFEAPFSEPF